MHFRTPADDHQTTLGDKIGYVSLNDLFHLLLNLLGQHTTAQLFKKRRVLSLQQFGATIIVSDTIPHVPTRYSQRALPYGNLGNIDFVEHTVHTGVDERSHELGGHAGKHQLDRFGEE